MANIVASRRYANALFSLSQEQHAGEEVRADLAALTELMDSSREWNIFVMTPVGSLSMRAKIMQDLFGAKLHRVTLRFLHFIDDKRRMNLLPDIYEQWLHLYDEAMGILRASATTAVPLDPEQKEELTKRLSTRFDKKVVLTAFHDPSLMGGMRIKIGDHILDSSVQTQLAQLKKRMMYA